MKAIITGGAGFIGHHLVTSLLARGDQVLVIDDLSTGRADPTIYGRLLVHDITMPIRHDLEQFADASVMFHLAAKARVQPSIADPIYFNQTNVVGTLRMLWLAKELGIRRFVFASSSSVYGNCNTMPLSAEQTKPNPISPYGLQKLIGEQYCRLFSSLYGVDTVCLRFFNVYGDGMSHGQYAMVIQKFLDQRELGELLTIYGDGSHRRDFTHVSDIVRAVILAGDRKRPFEGKPLNVGRGSNVSVAEFAAMVGGPTRYLPAVPEPAETLAGIATTKTELSWEPVVDLQTWLESTG